FAEVFALAQNGDPCEPRLESVENELFIECARIVFGHAPFLVVIGDVKRVLAGPGAANKRFAQPRFAFLAFFFSLRLALFFFLPAFSLPPLFAFPARLAFFAARRAARSLSLTAAAPPAARAALRAALPSSCGCSVASI